MPVGRQGGASGVVPATATTAVAPVAGARDGTTDMAGGLITTIDARGYKNATLYAQAGVIASSGSLNAKVTSSATSGGTYADISGAAVAAFGDTADNTIKFIDFELTAGKPFLGIVLVAVGTTTVSNAWIVLNNKMRN